MSVEYLLSFLLDNVVIVIATGVATGLIVWWLTRKKAGEIPVAQIDQRQITVEGDDKPLAIESETITSSNQISQTHVKIEGDNKPLAVGRDLIIETKEKDRRENYIKEERFEKLEQKIEEADERHDDSIREYNAAEREDVDEEELDDLDEDISIALDKLIEAWEKAAYYYKTNQIPRDKFRVLLRKRFKEFVRDPDIKGELRGKENIKWLKKELR